MEVAQERREPAAAKCKQAKKKGRKRGINSRQSSSDEDTTAVIDADEIRRSNRISRPTYRPEHDTQVSGDFVDELLANHGLQSDHEALDSDDSDFAPTSTIKATASKKSTPKKRLKPTVEPSPVHDKYTLLDGMDILLDASVLETRFIQVGSTFKDNWHDSSVSEGVLLHFLINAGRGKVPSRCNALLQIEDLQSGGVIYVHKSCKSPSDFGSKWWEDGLTFERISFDQMRIKESGEFINLSKEKCTSKPILRQALWTTLDQELVVVHYEQVQEVIKPSIGVTTNEVIDLSSDEENVVTEQTEPPFAPQKDSVLKLPNCISVERFSRKSSSPTSISVPDSNLRSTSKPSVDIVDLGSSEDECSSTTPVKATNPSTQQSSSGRKKVKKKFTPLRPRADFPLRQNQYKLALNFDQQRTESNIVITDVKSTSRAKSVDHDDGRVEQSNQVGSCSSDSLKKINLTESEVKDMLKDL